MDPNAYGRVYFEFDNAFAMSPMGDVLRDVGPVAVPLAMVLMGALVGTCLLYTSPSPRDRTRSRMPPSA